MTKKNVQVVQSIYDSFAEGDIASVLAAMDPQIEWKEAEHFPYADGNPYIGPAAVVEGVFARLAEEWDHWTLKVEEVMDAGDAVLARGRYRARYKKNDLPLDVQFAHVWWLRDGKVTRFQQYTDTKEVADVMKA